MKERQAIIVDDEPFVRDDLKEMLQKHPDIKVVGEAGSTKEARGLLERVSPDVVFLDIQLRGGSGFDLVPLIPHATSIIFFTAYDQYAVRAFEVNALDYLLKPVDADRLAASLSKLKNKGRWQTFNTKRTQPFEKDDQVFIQTEDGRCFVDLKDIVAVTSVGGNYFSLIRKTGHPLTVRRTLKQWEEILPRQLFFRIHRSTIVNLSYLERLQVDKNGSGSLFLIGTEQPFEVSRRSLPGLNDLIKNLKK